MAISTSPYQQNDYQAASTFRPYQLPVNDIFKALSAQNQFWEQGAARVKSYYDNALGLKLSLEPNKQLRDEFMKNSEKELQKLSSMNLADPSVQRQGMNVFKPIFQDEGIMYDDAMTRHFDKVRSDAMRFRSEDDGKGYSDTNLKYAMDGYEEFANSTDRMAGKAFYQKRKEYTPFHDPTSELNNILKNCKPDKAENSAVQGYYIKTYSNESLSAAKINNCMDAGLSDRAKRQLEINGYVTYKNNPEALRDKYVPHLYGTRSQLQEQKAAIQGVLANKNNLKNLKTSDLNKLGLTSAAQVTPEFIQSLQDQVVGIDERAHNLNETINKINSGDLSPIMGKDFERIASTVYSRDYMKNIGEGYSYNFEKNEMKADPVQMMFFQQSQLNARQEDDQDHDVFIKQAEFDNELKIKSMDILADQAKAEREAAAKNGVKGLFGQATDAGSIINGARVQNDTTSPFASVDTADSYDLVTTKRQEVATQRQGLNQWLLKELRGYGMPADINRVSGNASFNNFWSNFKTGAGNDPEKQKLIAKYEGEMGRLITLEDLYRNTQVSVDEQMRPIEEKVIKNFGDRGSVIVGTTDGNVTISSADIMNSVLGKSKVLQVKEGNIVTGIPGGLSGSGLIRGNEYYINGKKVKESDLGQLQKLYNQAREVAGTDVKGTRNSLMQSQTVLQREGYNFAQLNSNEKDNTFKQTLAQAIGLPLDKIEDLNIGQTDLNGRLVVSLNTSRAAAAKEYDVQGVLNKLKTYNGRDNKTVGDKNNEFMLEGISELQLINEKDMQSMMAPYMRSLEKLTTPDRNKSTSYIRSYQTGKNYRIDVGKSYGGGYDYKIISEDDPTSPVFSGNDRDEVLRQFEFLTTNTQKLQIPK